MNHEGHEVSRRTCRVESHLPSCRTRQCGRGARTTAAGTAALRSVTYDGSLLEYNGVTICPFWLGFVRTRAASPKSLAAHKEELCVPRHRSSEKGCSEHRRSNAFWCMITSCCAKACGGCWRMSRIWMWSPRQGAWPRRSRKYRNIG